jgi:D-serine deaminase-like pyridoxal phosphate-dependent protein
VSDASAVEVREELLARRAWEPISLAEPIPLDAVPTPVLLLDEAAFSRNLGRMAEFLGARGKGFRPHAKTHKCPLIANQQIEAGAVGICAAKVSEAWVLAHGGCEEILITSPVATADKAASIARLAANVSGLALVIDSDLGVEALEAALDQTDGRMRVLIDIDPLMGRTGVREADDIYRLAERIAGSARLTLAGVQHYQGHLMHVPGHPERRAKSEAGWARALEFVQGLRERGHRLEVVTGCGTGTYDIDCDIDGVTDLQVGSYVFMDQEYRDAGGRGGEVFDDFEVSLTVMTTAISQPMAGAITVDCGYKGFASDTVAPTAINVADTQFFFGGDEHGIVRLGSGAQQPLLGTKIEFVTPHCDPTVNLYDHYWVHRNGVVHALWPIAARGCSW